MYNSTHNLFKEIGNPIEDIQIDWEINDKNLSHGKQYGQSLRNKINGEEEKQVPELGNFWSIVFQKEKNYSLKIHKFIIIPMGSLNNKNKPPLKTII